MPHISIAGLTLQHSLELARILSTDERLHRANSPELEMREVQGEDCFNTFIRWAGQRHGICHAILLDGQAIGSISRSNIGSGDGSSNVGYWIGSDYWGKGYTTAAFQLIIAKARVMGIRTLTCTIPADNAASTAIWRRQGAVFTEQDGNFTPVLDI